MKNSTKFLIFTGIIVILFLLLIASPVSAVLLRTQTPWTLTGSGGVDVIPYVRVDKKALFVDFEDRNFKNVKQIHYKLSYDRDESLNMVVEGTFAPNPIDYYAYYKGRPYFRKELIFGTCSKDICTYDTNVRSVKLTVTTKMLSGRVLEYTKVLSFPDDQF